MGRLIFAISSACLLALVYIAESRTCKDIGGQCDSENDCWSGSCSGGQCVQGNDNRQTIKANSMRLGDMLFREGSTRSGIVGDQYRWPDANMTYELDPSFTHEEKKVIRKAFDMIASVTCVTFVPRTTENDWVYYNRGYGLPCNSYVGKQGGKQILNLGIAKHEQDPSCIYPEIIAHETIHALGFQHEMNRIDRDDYVSVNWENIACSEQFNFWRDNASAATTFDVPYDFQSIMHYGTHEGGIDDDVVVLIPKVEDSGLGRDGSTTVSNYDALKINRMYKCGPP